MCNMTQSLADIIDDFSYLDDWEDRYRHVIELGKALPPMPDALKTPATKVSGCASQVWIHARATEGPRGSRLELQGDSDALIVKGLIAIVFAMFKPLNLPEIVALDANATLAKLGLAEHLTPQRSNGLAAMIRRIKADAAAALPPA
jgi:cysteine desulfuration protein SufE